jgi:hypothetical protein
MKARGTLAFSRVSFHPNVAIHGQSNAIKAAVVKRRQAENQPIDL